MSRIQNKTIGVQARGNGANAQSSIGSPRARIIGRVVTFIPAAFIIGFSFGTPSATAQPVGTMQDLGTLGGSSSYALAASADGNVVVGNAYLSTGYSRAFRWTLTGGIKDLG